MVMCRPRGIGHDLADVVLRVIPAIPSVRAVGRAGLRVEPEPRVLAPRPDLRKARILLDFDAPALVVRQVQVERVDLVQGQRVEQLFDLVLGEEMAAHIEHQPAPFEPRLVLDLDARNLPIHALAPACAANTSGGKQLQQRLHPVKQAGGFAGPHDHGIRGHDQLVAFGAQLRFGVLRGQEDRPFARLCSGARGGLEAIARGFAQPLGQVLAGVARRDVRQDARFRFEFECPFAATRYSAAAE